MPVPIQDQIAALVAQIAAVQKVLAPLQDHPAPTVTVTAAPRSGSPLTWDFAGNVTYGDGATLSGVHWDFGQSTFDSTTSTSARGYVWRTAGSKQVTATVTDSWGASTSTSITITVASPSPPPPPPVKAGDSGVNQTGTAGKQQTGTGIIPFQNLATGSDLTATLKGNGTNAVSFAAGTFTWRDFLHGIVGNASPNGNNASGLQVPTGIKQVLGAGSASTRLEMVAHSSTKGSTVPSTGTNQLHYIDTYQVADGFVWDGINMVGTDQGHLYNGLSFENPGNATVSNSTFSGVPGSGGTPPGETSMVAIHQQQVGKTFSFTNCTFDGRLNGAPVTSAMLATNTTRGTITITDCVFQDNLGSAGPTIWELAAGGTINLIRPVTRNLKRNIGNEAQGGTINIHDPMFGDPASGEDDIRITWTSNFNSGTINIYFTAQANWDAFIANRKNKKIITICSVKQAYGGSAGGAYTGSNDIRKFCHIFVGGVEKTVTDYWTFIGSPVN